MTEVRVRFAPSPTGMLHIGGARTALFNWLFARHTGGKFILRIEDTDRVRSTQESEDAIIHDVKWMGLDWDEGPEVGGDYGPYKQTERLALYQAAVDKLMAAGYAYKCYCTKEELDAEREEASKKGIAFRYSGKCRHLTAEEQEAKEAAGLKPVIRFHIPEDAGIIVVDDLVRGRVEFDSQGLGDFIIVKSDGIPAYNFAVVIDDHAMGMTHILRAEEHLANTPRQILMYQALGYDLPRFAHISMILGPDRSKLSKRHGATSVTQYMEDGFLPEAIVNYLSLLGWSPEGEREFYSAEEIAELFTLDRVVKNPAVFDIQKLRWMNSHYIKEKSLPDLLQLLMPYLLETDYVQPDMSDEEKAKLEEIVEAVRDHLEVLPDIKGLIGVFYNDDIVVPDELKDNLRAEHIPQVMAAFKEKLHALSSWDAETVHAMLKKLPKELNLKPKFVLFPIRVALTGSKAGPELFNLIPILGLERVLKRLEKSLGQI